MPFGVSLPNKFDAMLCSDVHDVSHSPVANVVGVAWSAPKPNPPRGRPSRTEDFCGLLFRETEREGCLLGMGETARAGRRD